MFTTACTACLEQLKTYPMVIMDVRLRAYQMAMRSQRLSEVTESPGSSETISTVYNQTLLRLERSLQHRYSPRGSVSRVPIPRARTTRHPRSARTATVGL